jgi:putative ABC transport system permease protein
MHRDIAARELEEEIRLHIALRAESIREQHDSTAAQPAATMPAANTTSEIRDHAYSSARRQFGNATSLQERSRDMWGLMNIEDLARDVRFALRRLATHRGFALGVISVMAIGIGATTAMFSAVDAALLRPLPFHAPEQLVQLREIDMPFDPGAGYTGPRPPPTVDLVEVGKMPALFSSAAAYAAGGLNLADADHPIRVKAGVVTQNFFATLGIAPVMGRVFNSAEGAPNGPAVAVISYGLWQRQYGNRDISDLHITLGKRDYAVIGVMPERFGFPAESDVWIPLTVPNTFATFEAFRSHLPSVVIARLAPGVTVHTASAGLLTRLEQWRGNIDSSMLHFYDEMLVRARTNGLIQPLQQSLLGDRSRALFVLLGATGMLLLIACVNVTNLLLSQANIRRREIALRQVLGATRGRLVRQLLVESLLLACAGTVVGLLLAPFALRGMRSLIPASLDGIATPTIDWRVLLFATALALITSVAFGLWPAFRTTQQDASTVIKVGGGHGATGGGAGRAHRTMVSIELALTVMLLIGAGLMLRSFQRLTAQDNGMRTFNVGTLELTMSEAGGGRAERVRKLDEIVERLQSSPEFKSAGFVNDLPLNGAGGIGVQITIDGTPAPANIDDTPGARYLRASAGYFQALGISLLRGRLFTMADDSLAPSVAIISASMANKYWPNTDAVGRTFHMGDAATTVIGIVADVREHKLEDEAGAQMYFPIRVAPTATVALVARSTLPPATLLARMQQAVRSVDKSQAVYNLRMMVDVVSKSVAPRRTNTILIAAFALLALVLAAVGVYAVVSYGVSHRSRELAIRSALGASGLDLVAMISREMVPVALLGIASGVAGAWALAKTLGSLVYGVQVHDGLTFALVPLALIIPTALATLVPARRAWRVNPAEVMRAD